VNQVLGGGLIQLLGHQTKGFLSRSIIRAGSSSAGLLDVGPQSGTLSAVTEAILFVLAKSFFRRGCIRHGSLVILFKLNLGVRAEVHQPQNKGKSIQRIFVHIQRNGSGIPNDRPPSPDRDPISRLL
jgi:hypothetical protein